MTRGASAIRGLWPQHDRTAVTLVSAVFQTYAFFTRDGNDCWIITVHDCLRRGALEVGERMMGSGDVYLRAADMLAQAEQGLSLILPPSSKAAGATPSAAATDCATKSTGRMSVDAAEQRSRRKGGL